MNHKLALAALLLLCACSTAAPAPDTAGQEPDQFVAQDPLSGINQPVFDFNLVTDRYMIRPIAKGYHHIPETGREGISNFLSNLTEPANVLNSTLQGHFSDAGTSFWRFAINSTVGIAGLRDVATDEGLKYNNQHFAKTLARYDVPSGPYVVLPLLGPSDARGTVGVAVDWVSDPVGFFESFAESMAQTSAEAINKRDEDADIVDQFYYKSLDPYSATRAAYLQHEAFQ